LSKIEYINNYKNLVKDPVKPDPTPQSPQYSQQELEDFKVKVRSTQATELAATITVFEIFFLQWDLPSNVLADFTLTLTLPISHQTK